MNSIERAVELLKDAASAKDEGKPVQAGPHESGTADGEPHELGISQDTLAETVGDVHVLNFKALKQKGFLTPDEAQTRTYEEYRIIKRPLLTNAVGKGAAPLEHGNLVMVTSALPGEGKTFTSLNLAMSIAGEMDSTVLLIDSDVIKPSLTKLLGLRGRPGLIDMLLDESIDISDVIVRTNVPRLRVIPAGRSHGHSTELLSSDQMRRVAGDLSARYHDRVVLFDAPPLLATTQAHVLSDLMGQILIVVEAGRTPQKAVQEAVSQLNAKSAIGLILNKNNGSLGADYYGGQYGAYGQT